jgi:hypothetical protein
MMFDDESKAVPSIVVFGPHGESHAHYGRVMLGHHVFPISEDSALSRMYFRVNDVTGTVDPKTGKTKQPTVRFYRDPSVYFDAQNPHPVRNEADDDDDMFMDMCMQWKHEKELFENRHACFYAERDAITRDPGGYIHRAKQAAAYRGPLCGKPLLHLTE